MLAPMYARALYSALQDSREEHHNTLVENFLALLQKKGHAGLITQILREYEKIEQSRKVSDVGVLEVARKHDVEKLKDRIDAAALTLGVRREGLEVSENDTLVGGFILRREHEQVDASYRRQLLKLYQRLIST